MLRRILLWLCAVAVSAGVVFTADSYVTQCALAEKTIRLHVVANSDSDADQQQKLRVRNAVLEVTAHLAADCKNADEARNALSGGLSEIEAAAVRVLRAENCDADVRVTLQTEKFETRRYDTFTLPAGNYPSLRVVIGTGAGHNWWCVVFPSLCTAATGEGVERIAAAGGFDDAESELVTGGEEKYDLRFKTLEWLQSFFDLFD